MVLGTLRTLGISTELSPFVYGPGKNKVRNAEADGNESDGTESAEGSTPSGSGTSTTSSTSTTPVPSDPVPSQNTTTPTSASNVSSTTASPTTPSADREGNGTTTIVTVLPITKTVTINSTFTTALSWNATTTLAVTLPSGFTPVLKNNNNTLPIVLGGLLGLIALLLVGGAVVYCLRKRKDRHYSGPPGYGYGPYLMIPSNTRMSDQSGAVPLTKNMGPPGYDYPHPTSSFTSHLEQDSPHSPYDGPFDPYRDSHLPNLHRFPSDMSRSLRTRSADGHSIEPDPETRSLSTISSVPMPFHEKLKAARRAGQLDRTDEELEEHNV